MPGLEELLSFSYWTAERSEVVRNFSLALTGFIALFFLIWRAISADRAAKASMRQAEAALKQIAGF
jgi:hypothetical protein